LQRTECRGAERSGRIQGHDRDGAVLERDAAICEAERRGVGAVRSAYLYRLFAIKGGGRLRTDGERQARTLRQLVIVRELNVAARVRGGGLYALADEGDAWPGCGNDAFQVEHPPVLQPDSCEPCIARLQCLRRRHVLRGHGELVRSLTTRQRTRHESDTRERESRDLIEAAAGEHSLAVAGVQHEALEMRSLGKRPQRHRLRRARAVL